MSYPHQTLASARSFNATRLPLLVLAAMIAGLLGFAGSATIAAAQTDSVTYKGTAAGCVGVLGRDRSRQHPATSPAPSKPTTPSIAEAL